MKENIAETLILVCMHDKILKINTLTPQVPFYFTMAQTMEKINQFGPSSFFFLLIWDSHLRTMDLCDYVKDSNVSISYLLVVP